MIKARHINFYVKFFNFYTKYNLKKHFSGITIHHNLRLEALPVLLIGNHSTWWDGFFAVYLNVKLFKRKIHVMMLEEQLEKRKFFSKAGAFSIDPGSRSIIDTINYSREILSNKENLLLMFPQGEIQSSYIYPVKFEKGILRIIEKLEKPFQFVFFTALTDYFSNKKPKLDFYLKTFQLNRILQVDSIEMAYNDFLKACFLQQKK